MENRRKLSVFFGIILFVVFTHNSYAQTIGVSPSVSPVVKSSRGTQMCLKLTSKISQILASSDASSAKRSSYVVNIKTKFQNQIGKLSQNGVDTTKLRTDYQQISALLDKWLSDYATFISDLRSTTSLTCSTTAQSDFRNALQTALNQKTAVKSDRLEILHFFNNTFKPDFRTALGHSKGNPKANIQVHTPRTNITKTQVLPTFTLTPSQ